MGTLHSIIDWCAANWIIVSTAALLLVNVLNAITRHYSQHAGLVKVLSFIAEHLSFLTSKEVPSWFKWPLTSRAPGIVDGKLRPLHVMLPLALLLVGSGGCGSVVFMARPHVLGAPALQADTSAAWSDSACQAKQTTVTIEKAVAWALAPAGIVAAVVAAIVSAKVKDPETAALATGITSGALSAGAFIDGLFLDKDTTLLHDNCAAYSLASFRLMLQQHALPPASQAVRP